MEDNKTVAPIMKSLARHVTKDELSLVSGAGTVIKTSSAAVSTPESTYNKDGSRYIGQDTIEHD